MKDQLERNLYQHLVMAFSMGLFTVYLAIQPEPSWIPVPQAIELYQQGALYLDTRRPIASGKNAFPGALSIPFDELEERLSEVPRDRPVVVFGGIGNDSVRAYELLRARGYDVYDLGPKSRFPFTALHQHTHHRHHEHHEHHERNDGEPGAVP